MEISQVLKFEGDPDLLVWKHPVEDFNTTTQLVVDATHKALLVVNGNACDLFGEGRHTLETPNIPLVKRLINLPTGGQTPFPCKVFFISDIHQMDMTWGIPGEIVLDDPTYQILLHIGLCGNLNFKISDHRKFLLKMVGFRDQFDSDTLVAKFRGIIKQYVKSIIAKMMNGYNGGPKVSYFDMNENLFETSQFVENQLRPIFDSYGIELLVFNIETITVPDEDFAAIKAAKEKRASRIIEGYTWQEEQQMEATKIFAGNEGNMGNIGGAMSGMMIGGAIGGGMADMVRSSLSPNAVPQQPSPADLRSTPVPNTGAVQQPQQAEPFNAGNFFAGMAANSNASQGAQTPTYGAGPNPQAGTPGMYICKNCGHQMAATAKFCEECGTKVELQPSNTCRNCGYVFNGPAKFCPECGTPRN